MKKLIPLLLLLIALIFVLSMCFGGGEEKDLTREDAYRSDGRGLLELLFGDDMPVYDDTPIYDGDETWAVYWYLCGSDLEALYGSATADLEEMLEVTLPENVTVVIGTGGASKWQNDTVDPHSLERYVYNSEGLFLVDSAPAGNMGTTETLTDFLSFCQRNYPGDRTMFLFWNHGGGSVNGAAFDMNYGNDSLTLDEMYDAFSQVYTLSSDNPPFEVIGFDTCLMATLETAYTFSDVGRYLVASEEVEPGNGWNYTGWLSGLARNAGMDGAELGEIICDTYLAGCEYYGTAEEITLSVTDLSRVDALVDAYNALGDEALRSAARNPHFFAKLGRVAWNSENYGGNTPDQGFTNHVDLGHLVRGCEMLLPGSDDALLRALDEAVIYRVNGPYRAQATGLSCYYTYDGSYESYAGFADVSFSEPFIHLYDYNLRGMLSEDGKDYLEEIGADADDASQVITGEDAELADRKIEIDDDGNVILKLGREFSDSLTGIYVNLAYADAAEDLLLYLGRDNDLISDWENGIFRDNFRGVWGALNGHLAFMEIVYEGEDYNSYNIPILLNGDKYNLRVIYDFNKEEYRILGARRELENGMADKNLRQIQAKDKITTLHYALTLTGDDEDPRVFELDTFRAGNLRFSDEELPDGDFLLMFEMVDAGGQSYYSQSAVMTIDGEDIYVEINE